MATPTWLPMRLSSGRSVDMSYGSRDPFIERWVSEMPDDFRRRVLGRLVPSDGGCLRWPGHTVGKLQYGRVRAPGRLKDPGMASAPEVLVHRAVWVWHRGPIRPQELTVDHDDPEIGCHVRTCANVSHLRVCPQAVNNTSAINARTRNRCPRGHTVVPGQGVCLECMTETQRCYAQKRDRAVADAAALLHIGFREFIRRYGRSLRQAQKIIKENTS